MHLTYHDSKPHTSEVSTAKAEEAGAPDDDSRPRFSTEELSIIEVTPEMIEAGIDEFGLFDWGDPAEWIVPMIYRAMELQRRHSIKATEVAAPSQPAPPVGACSRS